MTQLLDQAFKELAKLPPSEQDALAAALLAELASEKRWTALFDGSQDLLDKLADEALSEHRAGKTKPM
jgi:histidinol-phosphate/aromatic aminotransferase/cobyric acid decarboxylase-like protein